MPDLITLPKGYTVRENRMVGVDYLDPKGNILFQHPKDDNAARILICLIAEPRSELSKRVRFDNLGMRIEWITNDGE